MNHALRNVTSSASNPHSSSAKVRRSNTVDTDPKRIMKLRMPLKSLRPGRSAGFVGATVAGTAVSKLARAIESMLPKFALVVTGRT